MRDRRSCRSQKSPLAASQRAERNYSQLKVEKNFIAARKKSSILAVQRDFKGMHSSTHRSIRGMSAP